MVLQRLGPYKLTSVIGRGGMGTVYRAFHMETDEVVAVKALAPVYSFDEHFRARFEAEIETLIALNHPNIVQIRSYGQEDGNLYFAMELVEGCSLFQKLKSGYVFHWKEVLLIARDVAAGLRHSHDRGIIHRDLKPGNLLLSNDNIVKITDFGIAKSFGGPQMTGEGNIVGTMDFMAPEQAQGKPATARSDLYSLGIVIYTLLTGRPPLAAQSVEETLENIRRHKIPRLDSLIADIPTAFADLVQQLVQKAPEDRIATALALIKQIDYLTEELKLIAEAKTSIVEEAEDLGKDVAAKRENDSTVVSVTNSKSPRASSAPAQKTQQSVPRQVEQQLPTDKPALAKNRIDARPAVAKQSAPADGAEKLMGQKQQDKQPVKSRAVVASHTDASASLANDPKKLTESSSRPHSDYGAIARSDYFNPVTEDLRKRSIVESEPEDKSASIWPLALMFLLAVVLLVSGLYYALIRKPSAESLLAAIDKQDQRLHLVRDEMEQFLLYYPDHERHAEIERLQKELQANVYTKSLEQKTRDRRTGVENEYLDILRERDTHTKLARLNDFITLREELELSDRDHECVTQARNFALKLQREQSKLSSFNRAALSEAIRRARETKDERADDATRILESAIRLYDGQKDVEDLLAEARELLEEINEQ
ncbi:MAG TPA: serine/threonine-protein kinase [Pirellulaceae bacterium]|nr:serine/threonine-protein kinase [Pirellulaceae bacterium]HMO93969.1 serine/threonine-protein kinase [Pirellulaceae bacterium]HMP70827.1 serine/threonine-protein kinase [Pirellulaceae bacterium]